MWEGYSRLKRLEIYNHMQCIILIESWLGGGGTAIKNVLKQVWLEIKYLRIVRITVDFPEWVWSWYCGYMGEPPCS